MPLLLDMDEVLVDFAGAAARLHGWSRPALEAVWPVGQWSIVEPMGLTVEQFWAPIQQAGEAFWTGLQPQPWCWDLLRLAEEQYGDDWFIVSSPSRSPTCYSGKVQWLHRHYRHNFHRLVLTGCKPLLARPDAILIDDREETVNKFITAGGQGVVFPCRHNRLHYITDPLDYVVTQLKERRDALSLPQL